MRWREMFDLQLPGMVDLILSARAVGTLNALEELFPVTPQYDTLGSLADWLMRGYLKGLISATEYTTLLGVFVSVTR